jgi:hypothetical protein
VCSQGPSVGPYTEQFESSPVHPTMSLIFIFILSSHLWPLFQVFFSEFQTKMWYALFITPVRATYPPIRFSWFYNFINIDKEYKLRSCSVWISLNLSFTSTLVEIFSLVPYFQTPSFNSRNEVSRPYKTIGKIIVVCMLIREPDSSIGITPCYELDDRGSIPGRCRRFISTPPRQDRPSVQWVPGDLSPGVKRMGREADHLPPR